MPSGLVAVALLVWSLGAAYGQNAEVLATNIPPVPASLETGQSETTKSGYRTVTPFGGPKSVGAQLHKDDKRKRPLIPYEGFDRALNPYYDFKAKLREKIGLSYGLDYNALFQGATETLGEDLAASGALRFFGHWELVGRESGSTGTFGYKVENRHRLGTDIAPQALGPEMGYAGLTAVPFSDAGWMLSNFFWQQELFNKRLAFALGIVDTTDYVDVYGLVNPWTDFNNLAFGNNPTIPFPSQGLGVAVRGNITTNLYVLAGFADANGDPTNPLEGFDTFFKTGDYFKHVEVGWVPSYKRGFEDNIHVTAWQTDARDEAGIPGGWGMAFSASHLFADRWLPFARFGWSDGGGGAFVEGAASVGAGYYLREKMDLLGLGLNWSRPSHKTYGAGLDDQYTIELFYRLQLLEHLALTPDVQVLVNPAQHPDADVIGVFGVRARLAF
jgi:porin